MEQELEKNRQESPSPAEEENTALDAALEALDEDEAAAEETPEQAPEEEATPAEEQEEDELTPPEGISDRARERFQKLASEVRELRDRLERSERVVSMLRETGATPEELAEAFEFIRLAKAGDRASLQQAAEIARRWLRHVSVALGEQIAVDPLAEHDDLREKVETGELSEQDAIEIARAREMQRMAAEQRQAHEADAAMHEAVQRAIQQVEQMEAEWAANDPDWEIKRDALMARIEEIARTLPPDAWPQAVRVAYEAINKAMERIKASTAQTPITSATARPATTRKEPQSLLDAAMQALEGEG